LWINEFISMWTPDIYSIEARAHPSAINGSAACRPPSRPLQGWLFQQPDLNATFTFGARAFDDSASVAARLLTYEFLRKSLVKF
jgi:hypothetical protein